MNLLSKSLENKTILITGGARNIGSEIVKSFQI
jgi:NAD(P)-dependent dehydrogenase (short-subunit alcohol dehydrogenase family)